MTQLPDVVYSVKADDNNEELRYSLRSLVNIPHGRVFISGYLPKWIKPETVTHINTRQQRMSSKYVNSRRNWYMVNRTPELSDDYIHMNDDFFIMKKMKKLPVLRFQGTLEEFIARHKAIGSISYADGSKRTLDMLRELGVTPEYYSYELHVPMMFNKEKMQQVIVIHQRINEYNENIHTRTFYGNYFGIGGKAIKDVKFHSKKIDKHKYKKMDFLSTDDTSFTQGEVGKYIREQFPEKSVYER